MASGTWLDASDSPASQSVEELGHEAVVAEGELRSRGLVFAEPEERLSLFEAHVGQVEISGLAEEIIYDSLRISVYREEPMAGQDVGSAGSQIVQLLRHFPHDGLLGGLPFFDVPAQDVDLIGKGDSRLVVAAVKEDASLGPIIEKHPSTTHPVRHRFPRPPRIPAAPGIAHEPKIRKTGLQSCFKITLSEHPK
jgi:hypothetical protein